MAMAPTVITPLVMIAMTVGAVAFVVAAILMTIIIAVRKYSASGAAHAGAQYRPGAASDSLPYGSARGATEAAADRGVDPFACEAT